MCIISFHVNDHPRYKLIVAANRDEFYDRPTKEAGFWEDEPNLLAGQDLRAFGTWLGITNSGRFAALTNYRDLASEQAGRISRGDIVLDFLTSDVSPQSYLEKLRETRMEYNGYNALVGASVDEIYYYGNRQADIIKVDPGTHTVSNHLLNTPWPKVKNARTMLHDYVKANEIVDVEVLFEQLASVDKAPDEMLPDTGVGLALERDLSPIFIQTDNYGTRASTVILVTHDNEVTFIERTFNSGSLKKENAFEFTIK